MAKSEEMPFGYGRMSLDRTAFLQDTKVWLERAIYFNNRIPMPYREYSPLSQFTDSLRYDSTAEMARVQILARCVAEMHRDLYGKTELLLKLVREMSQKTSVIAATHERESGKAWREEEW